MKTLKFHRLAILSDTTKSGNQFEFQKGYNLITGNDNSIGKTSLVKALLWVLGTDPIVDTTWTALDCKAWLELTVGTQSYYIYRHLDTIKISEDNKTYHCFHKITGEYAEKFAELVSFRALLANRHEGERLDTPPVAYYMLPFYIDQKYGWNMPWGGFKNLGQYAKWQKTIVKHHTGYLPHEHFALEEQIYEQKKLKQKAEKEIERIDQALLVVEEYVPQTKFTLNHDELEVMSAEVKDRLGDLAEEHEAILEKFTKDTAELYSLRSQLGILNLAIVNTEEDYKFTVENTSGDIIECPTCGVKHQNTILERASLLADNHQLKLQARVLSDELNAAETAHKALNKRLVEVRSEIETINHKYSTSDDAGNVITFPNIVDSLASKAVQKNVRVTKEGRQIVAQTADSTRRKLTRQQGKLLKKEEKDERNNHFMSALNSYLEILGASGINLAGVKSPLDYRKIVENGGAAESTRAILAYQMAVQDMIYSYGNQVVAPFIIDTPRQHEQADLNYQSIIELITTKVSPEQQVFLCALDGPQIKPYKDKATVIELTIDKKLLNPSEYEATRELMETAIKA